MIKYQVRSIALLTIVNEIRAGRLIPDAYFQRNLVWREIHKIDFIKTILLGLPFPQIFISKGKIDVEKMQSVSCIVDGQQRTNAIIDFVDNKFSVEGKSFSTLSGDEKSEFLKYEVPVIELDLENNDPAVQEIFQRINRTSNSLTVIEKLASQYATSEFMLVAKLLSDELDFPTDEDKEDFRVDPNIPPEFFEWAKKKKINKFNHLFTNKNTFTARELSKKAHLIHVLNIMSSVLGAFYNRNEKSYEFLDDYAQEFPEKDQIIATLESAADIIIGLRLPAKSYWNNKANLFSLVIAISKKIEDGVSFEQKVLKENLQEFENNIPQDYKLAATEAVNSTRARRLRNDYIVGILENSISA
jgi:hypothetical protein